MNEFEPKPGVPKGKRFSQIYVDRGLPTRDSDKMRHRISALLREMPDSFDNFSESELGLPSPYSTSSSWATILAKWDINDILALVTVVSSYFEERRFPNKAEWWRSCINRVFDEENLGYRVDSRGGVHPYIDEEFSHSRAATIAALSSSRYANVRNEFEMATRSIGKENKISIIRAFMAAEGLFRLLIKTSPRLVPAEVDKLHPIMKVRFKEDFVAEQVSKKVLNSFKDWIEACHFYRHEQPNEEVASPSIELTVHLVSQGASFIRLLAEMDALA